MSRSLLQSITCSIGGLACPTESHQPSDQQQLLQTPSRRVTRLHAICACCSDTSGFVSQPAIASRQQRLVSRCGPGPSQQMGTLHRGWAPKHPLEFAWERQATLRTAASKPSRGTIHSQPGIGADDQQENSLSGSAGSDINQSTNLVCFAVRMHRHASPVNLPAASGWLLAMRQQTVTSLYLESCQVSQRRAAAMPVTWPCRILGVPPLLQQTSRVAWRLAATLQHDRHCHSIHGCWLCLHAGRKKCLVVMNSSASETRHASIQLDLESAGMHASVAPATYGWLVLHLHGRSRCQRQCMQWTTCGAADCWSKARPPFLLVGTSTGQVTWPHLLQACCRRGSGSTVCCTCYPYPLQETGLLSFLAWW